MKWGYNMEVLFLGGFFTKNMEKEILLNSKSAVQYAANNFQWALIDGLIALEKVNLELISAPFIGPYPKEYKKINYRSENYSSCNQKIKSTYVDFFNLWGIRNISRKISLNQAIKNFILKDSKNKVIIVYSPHTPFLQSAIYAKTKDPSIKICLVVPDLPIYMNLNEKKSIIYNFFKKIDIFTFNKISKEVDSFILITELMKNKLNIKNKPYIVVEGLIDDNKIQKFIDVREEDNNSDEISIVYTGTLNKKFGILNLVEAFHDLDYPNVRLKICGRGDAEEAIKEFMEIDSRILYLGQLSNEEAITLQKNSTMLVNPRQNNEDFTKYSFPIKTMEYLLAAKPVIAYKLEGIPKDYDDYIFYIEDNSNDALKQKIIEVINLSDQNRENIGFMGREFVLKNKNKETIAMRIFDLIKNL